MNNKRLVIVLLLMIIFPISVKAFDFTCDNSKHYLNDSFNCTITGLSTSSNYETIIGEITIPDLLSCSINQNDSGLSGTASNNKFDFKGTPNGSELLKLSCKVAKEPSEDTTVQLVVNSFVTKVNGNSTDEKLRSNMVNVNKKVSTTSSTSSKNRSIENGNSLLKSVVSSDAEFTFSKYITEYNIQVLYSVKEVSFTYEKNMSNARVTLASSDSVTMNGNSVNVLMEEVGTKSFDLIVKSDDGGETVYTFNVERLDKGEGLYDKNTDATLSKLELGNYNIPFDPKKFDYSITVDSEVDTISVSATPTVDGASVVVKNNINIKDGTQIFVTVTALDKSTVKNYIITVHKSIDYTLAINTAIVACGAVLILIMVFSLIRVLNKKSKDDPIYKYKMKQKGMKVDSGVNNNVAPAPAPVQKMPVPVSTPVQPEASEPVQTVNNSNNQGNL